MRARSSGNAPLVTQVLAWTKAMRRKFLSKRVRGCVLAAAVLVLAACARSPRQRETRFMQQAQRLVQKKDYSRAALQFRNAIQAMPGDAEPYYQLGLTYLAAGNQGLAAGCFRKATELNPKHAAAQLKLADLLATADNPSTLADAQRRAQGVVNAFPGDVDALNTLALTEMRLGKPDEAEGHLEQALRSPSGRSHIVGAPDAHQAGAGRRERRRRGPAAMLPECARVRRGRVGDGPVLFSDTPAAAGGGAVPARDPHRPKIWRGFAGPWNDSVPCGAE